MCWLLVRMCGVNEGLIFGRLISKCEVTRSATACLLSLMFPGADSLFFLLSVATSVMGHTYHSCVVAPQGNSKISTVYVNAHS